MCECGWVGGCVSVGACGVDLYYNSREAQSNFYSPGQTER